jgi:cytidyltransferase-like protein
MKKLYLHETDIYPYDELKNILQNNMIIYISNPHYINYIEKIRETYTNIIIYYYIFNEYHIDNYIKHTMIDCIYYKTDEIYNLLKYDIPNDKLVKTKAITFGTFDLFNIGHKNIFNSAHDYSETLIVGIYDHDNIETFMSIEDRCDIVEDYILVDEIFIDKSLKLKNEYIKQYNANILIVGDDWKDTTNLLECMIIYLPKKSNMNRIMC